MSETWRRVAKLTAGLAAAALMALGLVAAAGPAGAAGGCDGAGGVAASWDLYVSDSGVRVWKTRMFRTSNCDSLQVMSRGLINTTTAETFKIRARTFNENGTVRVASDWVTVSMRESAVIRRGVDSNRLVMFDLYATDVRIQDGMHPPETDPNPTMVYF